MKRIKMMMCGLMAATLMVIGVRAETVTELVERMPMADVQTNAATFESLLALGADGLAELAAMVQPPATSGDAQARYLVSGVTIYAGRPGGDEARSLVERAWLAALANAEDRDIKAFFMRRLQQCGTAESRDALTAHLSDPALTDPAAQALLTIGAPGTADDLLKALEAGQGSMVTIIQTLGILEHGPAAGPIRAHAASDDSDIQTAALDALAAIGPVKQKIGWDNRSYDMLADACQTSNRFTRSHALGRCLRYAATAAERGAASPALTATRSLLAVSREAGESSVQAAALDLLTRIKPSEGLAGVKEAIHGSDRALSVAAIRVLMAADDSGARLAEIIKTSPAHVRIAAMDTLDEGTHDSVVQAVLAGVSSTNSAVQVAALAASARLAGRRALPTVMEALDSPDPAVLVGVQDALLRIALPEDMTVLGHSLPTVPASARVVLLDVLGDRRATTQWDVILGAADDEEDRVRQAAYRALGGAGTAAQLPQLVGMALATEDAAEQKSLGRAVVEIARSEPDPAKRCTALREAYDKGNAADRRALLPLLPGIGGAAALDIVVMAAKDQDTAVQADALRSLSRWPDDSAAEAMLAAIAAKPTPSQASALVRGLARVVSGGNRKANAKLALYREGLQAASRSQEKGIILGALSKLRSRAALDLASPYLDDAELKADAAHVVALSACPDGKYAGLTTPDLRAVLVKAVASLEDKALKGKLDALIKTMPEPFVVEPGFVSLFNGKDLAGWQGDTTHNTAKDGMIVAQKGNLFTKKGYADFVLKFQFKLTPGANNGIAIRWPGKGNPAYAGYELQVLDNTAEKYAKLKPFQYHGSIYSLSPAKRGFLKPVGEWNEETIIAKGDVISVILNGETIVDAVDVSAHGRPEHGRIGFCGHGDIVMYRNLRIKELHNIPPRGFSALWNGEDLDGWWGEKTTHYKKYRGLSPEAFKALQEKSREDIRKHWRVEGDDLVNDGHGLYLTTDRFYGDFELLLDYNTVAGADSGIYLRGIPQVQIWDYTKEGGKWKLGADKGSGGLWNNPAGSAGKDPLVLADKPFGEWNRFRIVMRGSDVSIWLNGKHIVDNAELSNYFDRGNPVPADGPIQLQTHGGQIRWRNIFIRELAPSQEQEVR